MAPHVRSRRALFELPYPTPSAVINTLQNASTYASKYGKDMFELGDLSLGTAFPYLHRVIDFFNAQYSYFNLLLERNPSLKTFFIVFLSFALIPTALFLFFGLSTLIGASLVAFSVVTGIMALFLFFSGIFVAMSYIFCGMLATGFTAVSATGIIGLKNKIK
ncbi:hypothetical protein HK096_001392 [Nowakowskiella sp. JEL0078]|nr:hypothetical protein HK096_001392 [Nowakowskiella sp. JEL0078]